MDGTDDGRRADPADDLSTLAGQFRLLGEVSDLFAHLDHGVAVDELARVVVPVLADWCTVTLVEVEGQRATLASAHRDPALEPVLAAYARVQAAQMSEQAAVAVCLRTGEPVHVAQVPPLEQWVGDPEARALLAQLRPASVSVLPLGAHGRTLGALALVRVADRGPLREQELRTALDVARRSGLALDNARLHTRQRHLVEALQRGLLTRAPVAPDLALATRYLPAAEQAQVGGDWHDAFLQPDGRTVLVIGDVMGHDRDAAAGMGQLRGMLRGIGHATGGGPRELLTRLDRAVEALGTGLSGTAAVVRLDPVDEQGRLALSWSNAGHPPPAVVGRDGSVRLLERDDADLLLGVDADLPRGEHTAVLDADEVLLLYTDGLVERRGTSLSQGLARLAGVLGEVADLPLEELCDAVVARLVPAAPEDDVALLAVRACPRMAGRAPRA